MQQTKKLHIALWVAQGLLAAPFIMAGIMKITAPIADLAANGMSFVNSFSEAVVRFIGISEALRGLGLILPALLKIQPILTPIAAIGLAIIMVLAAVYHGIHNELPIPIFNTIWSCRFYSMGKT